MGNGERKAFDVPHFLFHRFSSSEGVIMKRKFIAFLFFLFFSTGLTAFAANNQADSQTSAEKLKHVQEVIAKDAAFIRQINGDPQLTPEQRKTKIDAFLKAQNDEKK